MKLPNKNSPLNRLKHHVSGAIERGEKTAIEAFVKQSHTSGPWYIEASHPKTPDTYRVRSNISERKHISTEESVCITGNKANAHLIAAAPEMLEALELAKQDLITASMIFQALNKNKETVSSVAEEFRGKVRSLELVIAKARGE